MGKRFTPDELARRIAQRVDALPRGSGRQLIALAGPPACGKSTVSEDLCALLNKAGRRAAILPMDGFHLHNDLLDARGLRARKGAPDSFDLAGFHSLLIRLKTEAELYGPRFDRDGDLSLGSAVHFGPEIRTVIVEGNYLLLDAPGWRELQDCWDLSIFIGAEMDELRRRLLARWDALEISADVALSKVEKNDLPNAELVMTRSLPADLVF